MINQKKLKRKVELQNYMITKLHDYKIHDYKLHDYKLHDYKTT